MPGIESLQLTYGSMTGQFPGDMSNFSGVWQLSLIGNLLTEPFPVGFFDMPLWLLNLGYNKFKGQLPDELGALPSLSGLFMMENEFEGPLPDSLAEAPELTFLRIEGNPFFDATLPASWGNMTSLQRLFLHESELGGTIPQEWSGMTSMQDFRIYANNLEGPLPNMTAWQDILLFFVHQNRLSGTFPEELL